MERKSEEAVLLIQALDLWRRVSGDRAARSLEKPLRHAELRG